ncbi:GntR family transcriptional regulator [Aetokthonos hydrillicola Thurmond2011]|jgi:DNA-binding GntR family transcriptional regulator|uniref:GntR family transcriptional regulator n=1 Tax=Aetokthonos hydrillicola Thurmond2011 TaxID=2712845 RepID=A0AAP5MA64_9CYAN|nr:GntR family transcriptional regulator [Aetokthonos hydrillicola]MBO3461522.1 GntR family transcriptional regulator [Aetokthonos hydrillicola CCALA 1050]MBW4584661.1 GntR family transcriptional regulator [Aetokthonos hydrillicola CCALA 1050]MDR9895204.1 GntR family transcriptional regulator [Aetokthonos hydrillicola Thurmond2011]
MNLNDLAANVLQKQRSAPDLIAEALREAILRGIFQEGQSLRQDEIATQFGVSRIPVREALRQLEAEGLVTLHLNKGAIVSVLTSAEVQEIYEIRSALETTILRLAIPNVTESTLQKASEILEATHHTTDAPRLVQLNWEFHAALYAIANRPRLLTMIKNLHTNIDRYIRLLIAQMNDLERSQKEHYQLLNACREGDSKAAVELLKQHIEVEGAELVMYLTQIRR